MPGAVQDGSPPTLFGGLPRVVWVAAGVWCALLLVWSLVLPMFRSADEMQHVAAIVHVENHRSWPGFKALPLDAGVSAARTTYGVVDRNLDPYPVLHANDALPRGERPSFRDLGAGTQSTGRITPGQHPPGYYALLAVPAWLLPDSTPADLEAWLLRMGSIVLLAPLPVVLAAAVRRMAGPPTAVMIASILPLTVPQLAATGGAVNNDNLLTAAAAWVTLGVVCVLRGDLRMRIGLLSGLAVSVALLAKAFGLLLVPPLVFAYFVAGRRVGDLRAASRGLGALVVTAGAGGLWWMGNLVRYGQLQPSGHVPPRADGRLSFSESFGDFVGHLVTTLPSRFWAMLSIKGQSHPRGAQAVAFSLPVTATLSIIGIGVLIAAVLRQRTFAARRVDVVVLLAPFGAIFVVLLVSTWNIYARTGTASGLNGRYLFAGLPGVFIVVALVLTWWSKDLPGPALAPLVVSVGATAFTVLSLQRAIQFHWGIDRGSLDGVVGAVAAWSPLPVWMTVGVASAFLGALIWLWCELVREGLDGSRVPVQVDASSTWPTATRFGRRSRFPGGVNRRGLLSDHGDQGHGSGLRVMGHHGRRAGST